MSRETLEFHHDKHHLAYVNNGNNLMKGTEFEGRSVEDVVKGSFFGNPGLFNNAGQHYNHMHFWKWMKPDGGGDMPGALEKQIVADLGSVAKMKEDFVQAGVTQFGSGWCWLAVKFGRIEVTKTANGESPLVHGARPILGCDVWEHAYYIDYRNRRPDYLKAFVDNLVNWDYVAEMSRGGELSRARCDQCERRHGRSKRRRAAVKLILLRRRRRRPARAGSPEASVPRGP